MSTHYSMTMLLFCRIFTSSTRTSSKFAGCYAFDGLLDVDQQHALSKHLLGQIGFDFDRGRLDTSEHPFCSGTRDDIRMTGRYREDELGIMAPIHECGHAIYEKQLPKDWAFQPVGQSLGMAIHESQSLLHELQVARSPAYIRYLSSVLPQYLGVKMPGSLTL